jgi:hypothetical protein
LNVLAGCVDEGQASNLHVKPSGECVNRGHYGVKAGTAWNQRMRVERK